MCKINFSIVSASVPITGFKPSAYDQTLIKIKKELNLTLEDMYLLMTAYFKKIHLASTHCSNLMSKDSLLTRRNSESSSFNHFRT